MTRARRSNHRGNECLSKHAQACTVETAGSWCPVSGAPRQKPVNQFVDTHCQTLSQGKTAQTKTARINPGRFGDRGGCGMEQRQPINASMARRIGSGSVGQASMTLTKFGSVVSNPVSTESPDTGFPDGFSESEQVSNLSIIPSISERRSGCAWRGLGK